MRPVRQPGVNPRRGCPTRQRYAVKVYRLYVSEAGPAKGHVDNPQSAKWIVHEYFRRIRDDREHFVVLALTAKNGFIGLSEISTGAVTAAPVDPKVLFRTLLVMGAARYVLVHNHPSSDPTPSGDDLALTGVLVRGGELLDLECVDHLIVGDGANKIYSFVEAGHMSANPEKGSR
jgi:DNA repair protein RadC